MEYLATMEEIRAAKVTDVYSQRSRDILEAEGINKRVAVEFTAKSLPSHYEFGLFTGLGDVVDLLEGKPLDLYALPEWSIFLPGDPLMTIEGDYLGSGVFETAILGLICQASGVATKAARLRMAAGHRQLFGLGA